MPGFDEQEEESDDEIQIHKDEPSHAQSPARASTSTSAPLRSNKPISAKAAEKKRLTAAESYMVCPVCSQSLQTDDNRELNAHIDFCLSRGAIEEAKDLGPKETKAKAQSQADAWSWFLDPKAKPRSKGKGR